ncbi:MAG: homoserine O-acetyltransferase [Deltaproteobacteria bacterium]|nr:homoserine O-acetyltransferase [Deltaproteobacteria bacterium]
MTAGDIETVETQYCTIAHPPSGFLLENGESIGPVTIAYETYGSLDPNRSNAILVLHALTGDAHAAGFHNGETSHGWWHDMIGPGKAFDTDRYFVICSNVLGGCRGSTGPSSENPDTGRPYGLEFPVITIKDMVNAQKALLENLGIDSVLAVVGGSMGGMQALQWVVSYPEKVASAILIATTSEHTPQQIAFNEVGRQAIMADPNWNNGDYYGRDLPDKGLSVARMIGHITYMSDDSMNEKFGRRVKDKKNLFKFSPEFEVEGYLHYRGYNFINRFDPNSYLYITKAVDSFSLANGKPLHKLLEGVKTRLLIIAFSSDWLYPPYQSQQIVKACKMAGNNATYCELRSNYGHDAFLVEFEEQTYLYTHFLKKVHDEQQAA